MLSAANRLTSSREFAATIRRGRRAGATTLVVHLGRPADDESPARAGLVVSRAVGNAVARTRVKRRLRHLLRDRVTTLPTGSRLVVRALPPAAGASSAALGADLDRALARVAGRVGGVR